MAGLPGAGRPGGVPSFVSAPATQPIGDSTTYIARAPTFVPTWKAWTPPGGTYGFVDFLVGASVVAPIAMPGATVWSNPRGPINLSLYKFTDYVSGTAVTPPDTTHILRAPVFTPTWQRYHIENLGFAQSVPLTLKPAVVVQAPFSQNDWPNRLAWAARQDWIADTNIGLLRPDVAPFVQDDWPNPKGPQRGQDFVASTNLGLLRPDVNPFIPHDWANPRLALQPITDWMQAAIRAVVQVQAPFAQYDWPNRLAPRQPVADWMQQGIRAVVQVGTPFSQNDWPNPVRLVDPGQYQKWADYYSIQIIPLLPIDWTNPLGPSLRHAGYQGWIDYSMPPAAVTPPDTTHILRAPLYTPRWKPYLTVNFDWSQSATALNLPPTVVVLYEQRAPTFYKFTPQFSRLDWVQGTTLTLRPAGVVQPPLLPIDWPNPRGLLPANAGFAAAINLGLLRPDVNPAHNYDWPNPQRARQPVADWIASAFAALQTTPPPPAPFAQTDWPVPRGAIGVHVGSTSATQLGLLRPDVNPFLPRDFANPRGPIRSIDLYGWIQALSALNLPVPVKPPNAQFDWPNPAGPQRGIDLWGWSQPVTALNLPPTIIPPPTVLQPGGASVPHTFSRKRWKELQMLIAAEMAAVAKAERVTKPEKREALLHAARAAAAAVDAAEAEGENARLDKLLVRNAEMLRAAIRAATEIKLIKQTAAAAELSRAIVAHRDEEEENDMIALLLFS